MGQQDKRLQYEYELVSGNVTKVIYQKDQADQFYHEYLYDKDNRIKEVYTSRDSTIWDKDAKYFYYKHGPLARVEHGQYKVQAEDYAYTINGWIKGVNSGSLSPAYDMGKDGTTAYQNNNTNVHKSIAYDKFGYTLGYYDGDYAPINALTPGNYFEPAYSGTTFDNASPDLFNGNIRHMITALPTATQQTMGYTYQYDQLNRIKSMTAYHGMSSNSWSTGSSTTDYSNNYTYDANGNILTLNRRGAAGLNMDELSYNYTAGTNQLTHVDDAYTSVYNDDIDDQSSGNYTYTAIGELYSDAAENISAITWRVDGKVQKVQRNASGKTEMEFEYDAFGRRVLKIEKPTSTGGTPSAQDQWVYTYYVNDADGNVMAMYTLAKGTTNHDFKLENQHIQGNKRLGLLNRAAKLLARKVVSSGTLTQYAEDASIHTAGTRQYEYSNHLQNVLLVTSDRKIPYYSGSAYDHFEPQIVSYQDYYPFGSNMPDRGSNAYLYGFNGMLKDDNLKGNGNSYDFGARIYDSRIGRFFSIDPLIHIQPFATPYSFARNSPILMIDIQGLLGDVYLVVIDKDGNSTRQKIGTHGLTQKKWVNYFTLGLPGTEIGAIREFDYDITITINLTEKGYGILYGTENFTYIENRTEARGKPFRGGYRFTTKNGTGSSSNNPDGGNAKTIDLGDYLDRMMKKVGNVSTGSEFADKLKEFLDENADEIGTLGSLIFKDYKPPKETRDSDGNVKTENGGKAKSDKFLNGKPSDYGYYVTEDRYGNPIFYMWEKTDSAKTYKKITQEEFEAWKAGIDNPKK
jgi:RHS repeat-associated protein